MTVVQLHDIWLCISRYRSMLNEWRALSAERMQSIAFTTATSFVKEHIVLEKIIWCPTHTLLSSYIYEYEYII